jgi:hypothetical protein
MATLPWFCMFKFEKDRYGGNRELTDEQFHLEFELELSAIQNLDMVASNMK